MSYVDFFQKNQQPSFDFQYFIVPLRANFDVLCPDIQLNLKI